jgi:putative membrane protein
MLHGIKGRIEMSKTGFWGATALAAIVGSQGAQAQTPIPPSPKDFVMAASQSDEYEVLAARVASVQGQDPRIRTFAEEMIQDHTHLSEELSKAAAASGLPPPERGMSSDQAMLLSSLQSVRGPDFDKTYARQQELARRQ